jgi:pentose-5-phosphate-3-epimerase
VVHVKSEAIITHLSYCSVPVCKYGKNVTWSTIKFEKKSAKNEAILRIKQLNIKIRVIKNPRTELQRNLKNTNFKNKNL